MPARPDERVELMPKSLRTFLDEIAKERPGDLKEVTREVDADYEIAAVLAKLQRGNEFPAVIFRKVPARTSRCSINLHASHERMAIAMGVKDLLESEQLHSERESNPTPVKYVDRRARPCARSC